MINLSDKFLKMQTHLKPGLQSLLEDFSTRFGADFLMFSLMDEPGSQNTGSRISFSSNESVFPDPQLMATLQAKIIELRDPLLVDAEQLKSSGGDYRSLIVIPVELPDGPRCFVLTAFREPIDRIPETFGIYSAELVYRINGILFHSAIQREETRNNFLLSFAKGLGEIRDCKQLFYLLDSSLKPFIGYTDCTIFLLDGENGQMNSICPETDSRLPGFPFRQSINVTAVPFYGIIENNNHAANQKQSSFTYRKITENTEIGPFIKEHAEISGRTGHIFNLFSRQEVIGNCIFLFDEHRDIIDDFSPVMPIIVNLLTNAVINITAIKKIETTNRERDILQAINTEIAFNKDKFTLLKSINPKLRLLMDYSHHFVKAIDEGQLTVTGLLGDLDSRARFHPGYAKMVSDKFLISDQVFKVLLSNDPLIFDLEELAARQALPEYMRINHEVGIKKMAMLSLRVGSQIIGIWVICLLENQELNAYQLELLKGISHQLSVAAENIKAADIVIKKNQEREFLSRITADITAIRERKDLDKLFNRTLKAKLLFQEAVVMIKGDNETYNKFIYTPEMFGSDPGHNVDYSGERFSLNDQVFCRLMKDGGVIVYDMQQLTQDLQIPDYITKEYNAGVRTKVGVKLVRDKQDIGAVFFNFNSYHVVEETELYTNLSYHLSTAISNVLQNEEVIKREIERELLFSLSTEIASIRNPNQLIRIVTEKLKTFLGFSYLAIGTISETGELFDVMRFDPESICRKHPEYKDLMKMVFPVNDGVINKILMSPAPLSFDLAEIASKHELTPYLRISRESGVKQVIGMRFFKDLNPHGCMVLFFENEMQLTSGKISLISGIANQISIAVANIFANQELQKRVDDDERLHLFQAELRPVRDFASLTKVLKGQLSELFGIQDFSISAISEDCLSYDELLHFHQDKDLTQWAPSKVMADARAIEGSQFEVILNSDDIVFFDPVELGNKKQFLEFLDFSKEQGLSGIIGSIIKLGQQPIGFIVFPYAGPTEIHRQRKLFESVTAQIAIIVSNILSHQKIEKQLQEIQAYKQQLEEEKIYLTEEIETIHNYTEIIGGSTALKDTFKLVSQVSGSDSTVLILGETGTGKELIARAIHNNSPRKNKIMVKVNCAALPANLIESELFGHEKGSFTGATERRLGKFELANNGTLFLDEIGEMPIDLQGKLLRALQEREIERVGGKETIKIDVRIIAATNRDLEKEIAEGRFRNDLYYRLNIFPISLPPLRERKQDIEQLALHFIKQFNKNCGKNINSISSRAVQELMDYEWPGNIRELEHLIERSVLLTNGPVLKQVLLPPAEEQLVLKAKIEDFTLKTIDENEKDYILKVLKHCKGRIAGNGGAAHILGVPPTTLNSKIKRLGIKREHTM
ncbi:sigma-54-dependent Fis family transcriptional regulator [Pedobacter miscanthi]|nr:sigma 54-interacting transcriptional regulator [Pedobacter miscanthi]